MAKRHILSGPAANNVPYQRDAFALRKVSETVTGDVLAVGIPCGLAVEAIAARARSLTLFDCKGYHSGLSEIQNAEFHTGPFPPEQPMKAAQFDYAVCYHSLEKVRDDFATLREIERLLRPQGRIIVVTANRPMSITHNPYHRREYTTDELKNLLDAYFHRVEAQGVCGNRRVILYHERNRHAVESFLGFDFLLLHRWLPDWLLKIPYSFFNQLNRRRLLITNRKLTTSITADDYRLCEGGPCCFDLYFTAEKQ